VFALFQDADHTREDSEQEMYWIVDPDQALKSKSGTSNAGIHTWEFHRKNQQTSFRNICCNENE
jgi:hypothetical protein